MPLPTRCRVLVLAISATLGISGFAQESSLPQEPPAATEGKVRLDESETSPSLPANPAPGSYDELLKRLEKNEQEIARLNSELSSNVDNDRSFRDVFEERWSKVQDPSITTVDEQTYTPGGSKPKQWYDRLSIRGYAQFRYNFVVDEDGAPAQLIGDRSVSDDQSFLIRRARLIISGDVSENMYVYLQTDFASTVPDSDDSTYYAQIRDWYGDLYFDEDKVHRVRIGQSKVPYGWEDLQSSSNRAPLDRSDSINSATRNERDLGVVYYWTPEGAQDLFKEVLDRGLKGSGNYGVFGIGAFNGQGGSTLEENDNLHLYTRLAVPHKLDNGQILEMGVQAYTGKYVVGSAPIRPLGVPPAMIPAGTIGAGDDGGIVDQRLAGTFVWYPQPWGLQAEWNIGNGPGLNDEQTAVVKRSLTGGYVMALYRLETESHGTIFPFGRYTYYQGGLKNFANAPYGTINEWELGFEWQINPQMEFSTQYTIADRTNVSARSSGTSYGQFRGDIIRCQFQINY